MELIERYLVRVTLVLALTIYVIVHAGASLVTSPGKASLVAAVERTPVVLGVQLEQRYGCLTLAVLVQFRQERYGHSREYLDARGLQMDEKTLYPLLRRLCGSANRQGVD